MAIMRSYKYSKRNPYIMLLWLAMLGSVLIFIIFTVAYASLKGQAGWITVKTPKLFVFSTLLILLSSLALHSANMAVKAEDFKAYKNRIGLTLALGIAFVLTQIWAWQHLVEAGIFLQGQVSGSFIYLLSGLHIAHLILGLGVLLFAYTDAVRNATYIDGFIQQLNPIKKARLRLITIYWHFVGAIWLYLFLFFTYQQY